MRQMALEFHFDKYPLTNEHFCDFCEKNHFMPILYKDNLLQSYQMVGVNVIGFVSS